ncbi:immunity 49 family protein [Aquincola sp. S2]|uniref:Immunity 49 family protein n=1 Tax=Pseudaquabacterium terrae TaxID=2732868 RepID=A0ABX2EDL7_9BURK|nr:Imm49 family immunity protein [Aquabacterium terrae]NRF66445.1 immunity 49 family protein [Aquabacterium terrae]
MKLADYLEIVAYDIGFWLTAFQNPSYPTADLGEACIDVCAKLRAAAIIALLSRTSYDTFAHNLIRSGRCRVSYLQRVRQTGQPDHHQASARIDAFLDAVAAGDFALARDIASLSPRDWRPGHEYEDDWCHAQIAHALLAPLQDVGRIQSLFQRWEQVLDGQPEARVPVLRALADRDAAAFDAAFEALLDQRTAQIDAERARARIEEPALIAGRQIFVEGLAMLRIAVQLGLPTQREYRYCPSVARQGTAPPLAPEW